MSSSAKSTDSFVGPKARSFARRGLTCAAWLSSVLAIAACSSSSNSDNGGGDASTSDAGGEAGMPPIGVPLASCAGCPICGGALVTPDSGVSFCTVDCTTDSDCPAGSGTACIASINSPGMGLSNECIKTCSADGDCQSPFVCRHDLATPGGYCWSPYGETDASTPIPEAGVDSGASDGGTPESGATPDSGAADSGGADAADAGTTPDASNDGPSE